MSSPQKSTRHLGTLKADDIIAYRPAHEANTEKLPKPVVARVMNVSGDGLTCRACDNEHYAASPIEIKATQVLFNLGNNPSGLTLLGVDTNALYQKTVDVPVFGPVHWLMRPKDEAIVPKVHTACKRVALWLRTNKLESLLDLNVIVEVRPKHGKYAGCYKPSRNLDDHPGVLSIMPDNCANASLDSMEYVLAHELGHVIERQLLHSRPKLQAAWLSLYEKTVRPVLPEEATCDKIFELLLGSADFASWRSACKEDDETFAALKLTMAFWRKTMRLSPNDIDSLMQAEDHKVILKHKPTYHQLADAKLKPLVSEYACKNVRELFAEAFAFHVVKAKLPAEVTELVERSLSVARLTLKKDHSKT